MINMVVVQTHRESFLIKNSKKNNYVILVNLLDAILWTFLISAGTFGTHSNWKTMNTFAKF